MREILFRGRRLDNMEWVYGSLLYYADNYGGICVIQENEQTRVELSKTSCFELDEFAKGFMMDYKRWAVYPETVGQFTGLYDKNGKRIFAGDVLEIEREADGLGTYFDPPLKYPAKVVVRWDMCSWLWEVCGQEKYYLHFPDAWCHYKCQVVGNIYDNPELIQGG